MDDDAVREVRAAGRAFFDQALVEWRAHAPDFKAWTRAVGAATARKGATLYMPLRAALTGRTHGPELAPLVALMGDVRMVGRIAAAAERAAAG
jgi:glutamyl-tRNA synthetase